MNNYDFKSLSYHEFELLVQDLLQKEWGINLESFKQGKDGGIDLRYIQNNKNEIIVQCKHYANSTFSKLFNDLQDELKKVQKINPERYVVVTSQKLSPDNKRKIQELFKGYIKEQSDILGFEALNDRLSKYPDIERKHYKLWITSENILSTIFNNKIHTQIHFKLEAIKEKIKLFVSNPSVSLAQKTLQENSYVVICGNPGVGKSMLADMMIWEYALNGYEFINISEDINEGFEMFSHDINKKQIFYFDDFLGKTCLLEMLNKNEDSRLLLFINHIYKSKNKKLILTTREYILNNAKLNYERLADFNYKKCIIDLRTYTDKIKAEILYNHLFFSGLPREYFDGLIKNENYFSIISHKNYNPRIIEYMTKKEITKKVTPEKYFELFLQNLDSPEKVWAHTFENHLPSNSKSILLALVSRASYLLKSEATLEVIQNVSAEISEKIYNKKMNYNDYKKGLKILDGDFIRITQNIIDFSNPSVQDYLESHILSNELIDNFIELASTFTQYEWIYKTFLLKLRDKTLYYKFLSNIIEYYYVKRLDRTHFYQLYKILADIVYVLQDRNFIPDLINIAEEYLKGSRSINLYDFISSNLKYDFYTSDYRVIGFIARCKENILQGIEDYYSIDEFDSLGFFVDSFKELFSDSELEEIRDYFDESFRDIIEEAIDECDSIDELDDLRWAVDKITDYLELSDEFTEQVEEKIEELEEEEEEKASRMDYEYEQHREGFYYDNEEPEPSKSKEVNNPISDDKDEVREMFNSL